MSISKKKVPLHHFYSKPESYIQLIITQEIEDISLVDETDHPKLLILKSKNLLSNLYKSILYELKKIDNSKEYPIENDIKKITQDLSSRDSKKIPVSEFLKNVKVHVSELLNNNYSYYSIALSNETILIIQQKLISSYASMVIKKYAPANSLKKSNTNLSQAQTSLLRVANKLSMFQHMSDTSIIAVTSDVRFLGFEDAEMIFAQDTYGEEIYYVLSGAIQLVLTQGDTKIPLTKLRPGEVLGELAPILKQNRSAAAYALGETKLIGFRLKEEDDAAAENFLPLYKNFIKILSSKLLKSNSDRIVDSKK